MIDRVIVQVTLRRLWMTVSLGLLVVVLVLLARPLWAQKTQESFRDKFNIAEEAGGVAIATSGDGKYVYVAGRNGVIVSDRSEERRVGKERKTRVPTATCRD